MCNLQTYEDVISVKVEPDDNQDEGRHKKPLVFSGQDLKDLQSRLMLVAGKGNEEVDTFVEVCCYVCSASQCIG